MSKRRIKIRFSLFNRSTNSLFQSTMMVEAKTFHDVSDDLRTIIKEKIPSLIKSKMPAEDPANWELSAFQDWKEWHARVRRAKEAMSNG